MKTTTWLLVLLFAGAARGEMPRAGFPSVADCVPRPEGAAVQAQAAYAIKAPAIKDSPECHLTWQGAGIMQGFPPAADRLVTPDNLFAYPYNRWTLQHATQVMRTSPMALDHKAPRRLPEAIDPGLLAKRMTVNGRTETLAQFAERSFTDALVILRDGKVIAEWYGNGMTASRPHYAASVTKSVTGLLAEILIARGALDPAKKVTAYVPELAKSPFGEASVRDVLDMKVCVGLGETAAEVLDPTGARLWPAIALKTRDSEYEILASIPADGPNDGGFYYSTLTTEVAGWILTRAAGRTYQQLAHDELWSKLGVQDDVFVVMDSTGKAGAGYGMNVSARDLAKLGQMIADGGKVDGRQVLPPGVIESLFVRGDAKAWQRGTFKEQDVIEAYRSYWYQLEGGTTILGMGVFGQMLSVDRGRNIVVVKFGSMPSHVVKEYSDGWAQVGAQLFVP